VSRVRYLRELFASQRDATAIGVKLVYPHATRAIHGYLSARRARVIHLIRSNLLDAALSYEVASARQVFGARVGEPLPPVTVRLDAATLRRRLGQHEYSINVARSRLLLYRLPTLEVFYEELVAHHEETVAGVLEFLGVDVSAEPLQSTFAPIDDVPRADVLANLDEVERVLAGTRFEWMLAPRAAVRESIS
jgi:LPS sulfotransferase NodH